MRIHHLHTISVCVCTADATQLNSNNSQPTTVCVNFLFPCPHVTVLGKLGNLKCVRACAYEMISSAAARPSGRPLQGRRVREVARSEASHHIRDNSKCFEQSKHRVTRVSRKHQIEMSTFFTVCVQHLKNEVHHNCVRRAGLDTGSHSGEFERRALRRLIRSITGRPSGNVAPQDHVRVRAARILTHARVQRTRVCHVISTRWIPGFVSVSCVWSAIECARTPANLYLRLRHFA